MNKNGDAINDIYEKFSVNTVDGTALFLISLLDSQVRSDILTLNLSYNFRVGNSIYVLVWFLGLSSIKGIQTKNIQNIMML